MKNPVVVGRGPSCLFPASFERLLPLHSPAMAKPALWSLLLPGGVEIRERLLSLLCRLYVPGTVETLEEDSFHTSKEVLAH